MYYLTTVALCVYTCTGHTHNVYTIMTRATYIIICSLYNTTVLYSLQTLYNVYTVQIFDYWTVNIWNIVYTYTYDYIPNDYHIRIYIGKE